MRLSTQFIQAVLILQVTQPNIMMPAQVSPSQSKLYEQQARRQKRHAGKNAAKHDDRSHDAGANARTMQPTSHKQNLFKTPHHEVCRLKDQQTPHAKTGFKKR